MGIEQIRRVSVPPHRYTPLRKQWTELIKPLVEVLKLQVRMNIKRRCVELKKGEGDNISNNNTAENQVNLEKATDYVKGFLLGFDLKDVLAILRLEDLYLESFQIADVKKLEGGHLSRCIGRISGKNGRTKFAIENATRTRVVIADTKIHILGAYESIKLARDSICSLILGSPPGKVYNKLRSISSRLNERR